MLSLLTGVTISCDITDASIFALAQGCPLCSIINLHGCDNVTDASILALAEGCPLLSEIHMSGCEGVPSSLSEALKRLYPIIKFSTVGGCMMPSNLYYSFGEPEEF